VVSDKPDPFDRGLTWALATLAACLWALWALALHDALNGDRDAAGWAVMIPIADLPLTVGLIVARRTRLANARKDVTRG
jgi:hypothetical protein